MLNCLLKRYQTGACKFREYLRTHIIGCNIDTDIWNPSYPRRLKILLICPPTSCKIERGYYVHLNEQLVLKKLLISAHLEQRRPGIPLLQHPSSEQPARPLLHHAWHVTVLRLQQELEVQRL